MSMSGWEAQERTDRILAQTTALLVQRGDEQAVALLIDVQSMAFVGTDEVARRWPDPWGDLTITDFYRAAVLDVDDHLISRFTEEIIERILPTVRYVAERNGEDDVLQLRVRPALPEVDENWRETYASRLATERPMNQARRERGITQYPVEDALTFGSGEELRVYRVLRHLQSKGREDVTFAIVPLPGVRLRCAARLGCARSTGWHTAARCWVTN